MKTSSVCLLLGVSVLLPSGPTVSAVSLSVSPNLQQFFSRISNLTLRCDEDGQKADGWTVKRTTRGGGGETKQCGNEDFGKIEDSFCIISGLLVSDSGVYWCETSSGEKSEQINITVTDGPMILEIPALPVLTGSDVTLRCRFRYGVTHPADVLKNGQNVTSDPTGEFNISNIQQSDEGFYSCAGQTGESPRSRLRVKVSLSVSPNLQQFFSRISNLTLRCDEDGQKADGWTVKRTTRGGGGEETKQCGNDTQDFGRIKDSFCIISPLFPASDSGVYWCETSSGEKSEQINITVTGGPVILEIPALPVLTGSDVTLRCRFRDGVTRPADVLKNGQNVTSDPTGEFNINNVQQSDEGFYSCAGQTGESPRSKLRVKASPPNSPSPVVGGSGLMLLRHLVVVCLFCISTVLMVSIYCSRRTGNSPAVSMEMTQRDGGGQGLDGVYDDIAADVTTEHNF